jgi:uncharacterized protein
MAIVEWGLKRLETTLLPVCSLLEFRRNYLLRMFATATLTDSFLDFSASRGNNLRSISLTAGCKWCLCAGRWKEALDAASKNKDLPKDVVPKVHLHATHEKALDSVSLDDPKAQAASPKTAVASGRQDSSESSHGGRVGETGTKKTTELANKDEMTSREL